MNNSNGNHLYAKVILVDTILKFYFNFHKFHSDVSSTHSLLVEVALMYELPDVSSDNFFYCHQPAQIAGCGTVVLATPPSQDGSICKVFAFAWHFSSFF